jgi:hypothetical protein
MGVAPKKAKNGATHQLTVQLFKISLLRPEGWTFDDLNLSRLPLRVNHYLVITGDASKRLFPAKVSLGFPQQRALLEAHFEKPPLLLVGARGFEPPTPSLPD